MSARTGSWLVAAAFLVTMIGTTIPTPLYPLYQRELGFGGFMVTVVFATYAVGVLMALLLVGRLSDQVGRKAVLLPGLGLAAASSLVFLIPHSLVALFINGHLLDQDHHPVQPSTHLTTTMFSRIVSYVRRRGICRVSV